MSVSSLHPAPVSLGALGLLLTLCGWLPGCDASFWRGRLPERDDPVDMTCTDPRICPPPCDPAKGPCSTCKTNTDCSGTPDRPVCDPAQGGLCIARCQADKDCAGTPGRPVCDVSHGGVCVARCQADKDCAGALDRPSCDLVHGGVCVAHCKTDKDCAISPDRPFCDAAGSATCTSLCQQSAQCAARDMNAPYCWTDGTCRACQPGVQCMPCHANADCTSELCMVATGSAPGALGACTAEAGIAYVDSNVDCAVSTGTGTRAQPFCDLFHAAQGIGRTILLRPSARPYQSITFPTGTFTVVGPWADPKLAGTDWDQTPGATIIGMVRIYDGTTVTVDGVGFADGPGVGGIACQPINAINTTRLTLRRVVHTAVTGISAASCNLTMQRCHVERGGLDISDNSDFHIENTIVENVSGTRAVFLRSNKPGTFLFNTIVNNNAFGIDCSADGHKVATSIVIGNGTFVMPTSQISAKCLIDQVVVGPADQFPGGIKVAPDFQAGDNRLLPASTANNNCCINKATAGPVEDFFGNQRPGKGGAYTLGYDEP